MTWRKNRFSMRLADDILDLPWRVPARELGVTLLRSLSEPDGLRQILDEHCVFALPELAREIDTRLTHEDEPRGQDVSVRLEPYLRELRKHEPLEYGRLLVGCAEFLLNQRVRSRQASMRAVELRDLAGRLTRTSEAADLEPPVPEHPTDESAWARQQLAAAAPGG